MPLNLYFRARKICDNKCTSVLLIKFESLRNCKLHAGCRDLDEILTKVHTNYLPIINRL
jgi:hypothetical protein